MKSSKTVVLVVVAIGCGLVAAYLTAKLTAHPQANTELVWVAREKIPQGQVMKEPEKLFYQQEMLKDTAKNWVSDLTQYKDKMVTRTIQPGQWVTADDLSSNAGIAIPEGFQAMAVKVSAATAASGFVLPGSKVNVVATIREQNKKPKVQTVMQDKLVLAVDQNGVRPDGTQAIGTLSTVLLAVTPKEALKLALAQSQSSGELQLVLRSPDDKTKSSMEPVSDLTTSDDNGFGSDGPTAPPKELPKVLVAREDIKQGTTVDDPARFFEVKEWAGSLPDKVIGPDDLNTLKDKVVKNAVPKGYVLSGTFFDGDLALTPVVVAPAKKEPETHVMFIQNGGREPITVRYQGGQTVDGGEGPK